MSRIFRFLGASKIRETPQNGPIQPHQRLRYLKFLWHTIQRNSTISDKSKRQERLIPDIEKLTELLVDECTRPDRQAPRASLEYTLQRGIFSWLATLAIGGPQSLTRCIISSFTSVVEVEDDDFLTHEAVCKPLASLFRYLTQRTHKEALMDHVIQLLFAICSKVRHYPALLAMFFDGEAWLDRVGPLSAHESVTSADVATPIRYEDEFLIFYLLLDNMHLPEQNGDFCRTGLLYVLRAANAHPILLRWIADSELPTFLTVGLGSHFSALGSKLRIEYDPNEDLLLASSRDIKEAFGKCLPSTETVTSSINAKFVDAFEKYLTYLAYWQDILEVCTTQDLRRNLLESYRVLFLQCILYPSLLESSDFDGGSAVAVSTYLASTLDIITEPDLVEITLQYLFASEDKAIGLSRASKRATLLVSKQAGKNLDPGLFSLKDMILLNLRSRSLDTKTTTLKLFGSLIRNHLPSILHILLKVSPATTRNPSIGHHQKEMQLLASLIGHSTTSLNIGDQYQNYLYDAATNIKGQDIEIENLLYTDTSGSIEERHPGPITRYALRSEDPLLRQLTQSFSSFFTNKVEFNLHLTKIVVDLAYSYLISLDGWLLFSSFDSWIEIPGEIAPDYSTRDRSQAEFEDNMISVLEAMTLSSDEKSDDVSIDFGTESSARAVRNRTLPTWSRFPPLLTLFKSLAAQILQYKSEIETLESDLGDRREAFALKDKIMSAAMIWEAQNPESGPMCKDKDLPTSLQRKTSVLNTALATPTKETSKSPFSSHFSSTKRSVSALHPIILQEDCDLEMPETPTRSRSKSTFSVLDAHLSPVSSSRSDSASSISKPASDIDLSKLINNIIIFEEFVMELTAVIQVRRSLIENCDFV